MYSKSSSNEQESLQLNQAAYPLQHHGDILNSIDDPRPPSMAEESPPAIPTSWIPSGRGATYPLTKSSLIAILDVALSVLDESDFAPEAGGASTGARRRRSNNILLGAEKTMPGGGHHTTLPPQ